MGFYKLLSITTVLLVSPTIAAQLQDTSSPTDDAHHCIIDPSFTESQQFYLLGLDFVPLIINADEKQLQPFGATDEQQVQAIDASLEVNLAAVATFHFQKCPNASDATGLYDLVITGPEPQYVAKAADGGLVLTSASTGPIAQNVDGRSIATTIFTVDCDGRIGVMQEGIAYVWDATVDGKSTSFTAGAHSSNRSMVAFNLAHATTKQTSPTEQHLELRSSVLEKRDLYRCSAPEVASTRPGARAATSNGCGSKSNHKIVPDFGFTKCCNIHDLCYDDCSKSFDECNYNFRNCMSGVCKNKYSSSVAAPLYAGCILVADTYFAVVSGSFGSKYFAQYTHERCQCCPPPGTRPGPGGRKPPCHPA